MGGVDLVDVEVLLLVLVLLHRGRQVDGRPLGGGGLGPHPAYPLLRQRLRRMDGHIGAGEGLAVHAEDAADAVQVQAGGEGLQHLLRSYGLQAEEGFPSLAVDLEEGQPLRLPGRHLVLPQAGEDAGEGLEELHGPHRGVGDQLFGQADEVAVSLRRHLGQGAGCLGEVGEGLSPLVADDVGGEAEEAAPLLRVDLAQEGGAPLQVGTGIGPAGVGQGLGEAQEGQAVLVAQRLQNVRGHAQAVGGQVVGAVAEDVQETDQHPHLGQGEAGEEDRAVLEELDGQRGGAPATLVELPPQGDPAAQPLLTQEGDGCRAGAEVGGGQGGGDGGQLPALTRPFPEAVRTQDARHLRGGQVVFAAGLPGPPGLAGHLQPFLGPAGRLLGPQERGYVGEGAPEVRHQGGGEGGELPLQLLEAALTAFAIQRSSSPPLGCCAGRRARR
ncbi:hypothetical protein HRbin25_00313 [bacterium HR25]|nr:hypothetical protein HRbin25_00313 [bacterium HR25]